MKYFPAHYLIYISAIEGRINTRAPTPDTVFGSFLPRNPSCHLSVVLMRETSDAKSVCDTHTMPLSISWRQPTSPRQPSLSGTVTKAFPQPHRNKVA